jgi:hypothetical protein
MATLYSGLNGRPRSDRFWGKSDMDGLYHEMNCFFCRLYRVPEIVKKGVFFLSDGIIKTVFCVEQQAK